MWFKIKKIKNFYIEIPIFPSTPKKLNLKGNLKKISKKNNFLLLDLTNDNAIKRIEPNEIELGKRISFGASGEVLRGIVYF